MKRASESFYLGPAEHQPYQNIELLLDVAKQLKVDAIHPGSYSAFAMQSKYLTVFGQDTDTCRRTPVLRGLSTLQV